MIEVSELIGALVSEMETTISGVYNTTYQRTDICSTKWLREGRVVTTDQPEAYLIEDLAQDQWALGTPIGDPLNTMEGVIQLPVPTYLFGTKLATNLEWTKMSNDVKTKTPIIWLLETTREKVFGRGDTREREFEIRMFFLDETNIKDYATKDHREQVVRPMQQLVLEFLETIKRNRNYQTIEDYEMFAFSRFGVQKENGYFQNILDANLSGVELRMTLTRYKQNCKC